MRPLYREFSVQAEFDAQYNPSLALSDPTAPGKHFVATAKRARAELPCTLDLPYGPTRDETLDIFPAEQPNAPVFVFIHGGYWQKNSREGFSCMAETFLARGWSAALPSHTLAPNASLTQIAAELRSALDLLQAQGARLGVTGPVVLSGWSAGGHLAALLSDHPLVKMAAPISGIFELAPIRQTRFDEALKLTEAEVATLSPMRRALSLKPHLLFVGARELPELRRQSLAFREHRAGASQDGYYEIAGRNHFDVLDDLMSPQGAVFGEIVRHFQALS